MRLKRSLLYCIGILYMLMLFTSCSKNDTDPGQTEENNRSITLTTTSAIPGQIVVAKANFKPATDSLSLFIEGKRIMAGVSDSNEIVFVMPVVPQGTANIDFKNAGLQKTLSITVNAYTPITQPDAVIATFQTKLNTIISEFEKYETNPHIQLPVEHGDLLNYLKEVQTTNYTTLSMQDKIEFASFIQANMPAEADFVPDTLNSEFYSKTTGDEVSPAERIWKVGNEYKASVIRSIAFLTTGVALAMLPEPTMVSKLVAVGLITKGILELDKAISNMKEMYNLMGVAVEIKDPQRLNPQAGEITLVKDLQKEVTIKASHRSIITSDVSTTNAFIKSLFDSKAKADALYAEALNAINKIKSWFGGNPATPPANNFKAASTTKDYALLGSGISVDNVSNSAIQLTYVKKQTSVSFKATSTSITTPTPFTFRVSFKDPYTGIELSKTMNAVYKPESYKLVNLDGSAVSSGEISFTPQVAKYFILQNEDGSAATGIEYSLVSLANNSNNKVSASASKSSNGNSVGITLNTTETTKQTTTFDVMYKSQKVQTISASVSDSSEMYRLSAIGKYVITNYKGNGPNSKMHVELLADGKVTYTIYDDPSWSNGTQWYSYWSIKRSATDGRYYYNEGGGSWFSYWRAGAKPLNYPVTQMLFKYDDTTDYVFAK